LQRAKTLQRRSKLLSFKGNKIRIYTREIFIYENEEYSHKELAIIISKNKLTSKDKTAINTTDGTASSFRPHHINYGFMLLPHARLEN
jgi:GH25 family lysozyme M1 (1,4-beta-N-acetylmuramidase)